MGPGVKNCVRQKTPIKCNNPLTVHRLYPCQIPWYHAHLFTLRRIEYVTHSHFYNLECTSSELIQVFQNLYRISECRFEFQKTVFVSESRWHLWATVLTHIR